MKRHLLASSLALIATLALIAGAALVAQAASTTLTGWLWSGATDDLLPGCNPPPPGTTDCGGVGWVSFSSATPNAGGNVSYGISIPPGDGPLTGYAWSNILGWINFQPTSGFPASPNYGVKRTGGTLDGWARVQAIADAEALGNSGGWGGWIKFKGSNYGITIAPSGDLAGYAWSPELGWFKFIPPPPTCSITFDPTTGNAPLSGTVSWTTKNTPTSCSASGSGGWSGAKLPVGGS